MALLKDRLVVWVMLAAASFAGWAQADENRIGEDEYKSHCAVCHGPDGKGNSAFSGLITIALPDLTRLSANNGGVFPLNRVYAIVDGREELKAHGTRYMPIWGSRYSAELTEAIDPFLPNREKAIEKIVNTRIVELVFYIASLQK